MTLADLTLPINYQDAQAFALAFSPELAAGLAELHAVHGSPNCVPTPRVLTDGRLMLTADILTEVMPGGLLADMWQHIDHATVDPQVEVLPISDAIALLPDEQGGA